MEREHVSLLRRHLHAAGSLSQTVADAASPLALSQSLQARTVLRVHHCLGGHLAYGLVYTAYLLPQLAFVSAASTTCVQVAVQSMSVCSQALHALAVTTQAVELDANKACTPHLRCKLVCEI